MGNIDSKVWPMGPHCPLTSPGPSRSPATCLPAVRPSHMLFPPQLCVPGNILDTWGPPETPRNTWYLSTWGPHLRNTQKHLVPSSRLHALMPWSQSPPPRPCSLLHPAILPLQAVTCALLRSFSSRGLGCTIILSAMLPVKPNTYS